VFDCGSMAFSEANLKPSVRVCSRLPGEPYPYSAFWRASTPNCLAYEAGAEALPVWEEIWLGPAIKLVGRVPHSSPLLA